MLLEVFQGRLEYYWSLQFPLSVSGELKVGNKLIALLHENVLSHHTSQEDMRIDNVPYNQGRYSTDKISRYYTILSAELSPNAVDWIEICREKSSDKSVSFICNFLVKFLHNSGRFFKDNNNREIVSLKREIGYSTVDIEQSRWIREFAPVLGIGKYFLVEQKQKEHLNIPDFWKQIHGNMTKNLQDMEHHLKAFEWQEVMEDARKFYENAKIGDDKVMSKDFKQEFDQYLIRDNHTEEGMNNFYDGIWKFFEFTSKYVHHKDRQGSPLATVIARKEDAYFAYSLALGLFNLITQKVEIR